MADDEIQKRTNVLIDKGIVDSDRAREAEAIRREQLSECATDVLILASRVERCGEPTIGKLLREIAWRLDR